MKFSSASDTIGEAIDVIVRSAAFAGTINDPNPPCSSVNKKPGPVLLKMLCSPSHEGGVCYKFAMFCHPRAMSILLQEHLRKADEYYCVPFVYS